MCVDYIGLNKAYPMLNKAYPKDSCPLPRIENLVDATLGHVRLSFSDIFFEYHQICMVESDQEKTSFNTDFGTLFHSHAIRIEKCWGNLSKDGK